MSACAGLVYDCPSGVLIANTGNVPMSFEVPNAASRGQPGCRRDALLPTESMFCDFVWSVTQPELELGQAIINVAAVGSDLLHPEVNATYESSVLLSLAQAPSVSVKLEQQQPHTTTLVAGTCGWRCGLQASLTGCTVWYIEGLRKKCAEKVTSHDR